MLEIKIHKSSDFSAPLIKALTVDNLVPPNKSGSQFQRLWLNESKYYFTVLLGKFYKGLYSSQTNKSIFFRDKVTRKNVQKINQYLHT